MRQLEMDKPFAVGEVVYSGSHRNVAEVAQTSDVRLQRGIGTLREFR